MFYCFNQNNSGGSFQIDDRVSEYVIIEADSASEANDRAENVGIYFNGCDDERDCPCCGDRWYPAWKDEGDTSPTIYGKPVSEYDTRWVKKGTAFAYVYYKDGRKESFFS